MRSEELERLRRRATVDQGHQPTWADCFLHAARDRTFWDREVRDPALLYLARVKSRAEITDDGTTLAVRHPPPPAPPGDGSRPLSRRERWQARQLERERARLNNPPPPPARPRPPAADEGEPEDRSTQFCNLWNAGKCSEPCPNGRIHKCPLCKGAKPPTGHKRPECPDFVATPKGSGKGGGKRKR